MIDDLDSSESDGNRSQIELAKYADIISRHRMDRKSSQRWARNLRFLTFDDNDEEDTIIRGNVGIKRQCQQCEQNRKPLPGHVCAAHRLNVDSRYLKARDKGIFKYPDVCVHVREASCQSCEHIPLFPNSPEQIRFRIRRIQAQDTKQTAPLGCDHFVAVSYCWTDGQSSADSTSNQQDNYTVIEEDGVTARAARAPRNVLDRAIDFCRQNGMRMIWIDQECIQQDDEVEKSAAVQAMDIIYSRAFFSIGVLQAGFRNQNELDAFCALGAEESIVGGFLTRPGRCKPPLPAFVKEQVFVDMLHRLSENRWFTRAWTFEEAFVSRGEMIILIPKPKTESLSTRGRNVLCNDLSTSEVAIKIDLLDEVLKAAVSYFDKKSEKRERYVYGLDCSKRGFAHLREVKLLRRQAVSSIVQKGDKEVKLPEDWPAKLALLGRLYPEILTTADLIRISVKSIVSFPACNAAGALSFLAVRHNSVTADRLAIIANICDYDVRLDLMKLTKSNLPLSACILMLALMNGDFSLLCPESYNDQTRLKFVEDDSDVERPFSWLRVDVESLKNLSQDTLSPENHNRGRDDPRLCSLTDVGLTMPGCLWKVDTFLDLGVVQRRYRPGWKRLQARRAKKDPTHIDGIEEEYRLATTHILFEILSALKSMGEMDAANAIWQSTFDSRWRSKSRQEGIETVAEWPEKLQVHNRAGMFRVETNSSGDYNCSWLIERVMANGGMWVGSFVNGSFETALQNFESDSTSSERSQLENLIKHLNAHDVLTTEAEKAALDARKSIGHGRWPHLETDLRDTLEVVIDIDQEASLTIEGALSFSWKKFFAKTADVPGHYSKQRAVFDIDGDTESKVFVFSPFRRTIEMLPTPAVRTMSISWVVDLVESPKTHNDKSATKSHSRSFRTRKMVRGMWPLQDIPGTRYQLV